MEELQKAIAAVGAIKVDSMTDPEGEEIKTIDAPTLAAAAVAVETLRAACGTKRKKFGGGPHTRPLARAEHLCSSNVNGALAHATNGRLKGIPKAARLLDDQVRQNLDAFAKLEPRLEANRKADEAAKKARKAGE